MSTKILGNSLAFKTFDYLGVNQAEIKWEEKKQKPYYLPSDKRIKISEFEEVQYGVSKENTSVNELEGNLYRRFEAMEGKPIYEVLHLKQNEQYPELLDTYDVIARKNANLTLILGYGMEGMNEKYRNTVIRILAEENSKVHLFVIQNIDDSCHTFESIVSILGKNAKVTLCQFQLGAKELYTNFKGELKGENAELEVDSIYFGYGEHELNLLYDIVHYGEGSTSNVVINGALKDNSSKNFKSTLDFKEGSSFAVGSEEEYAILMSDRAKAISVPLLLAHEDNVEGNHAASAGKIDKELLFYIMSRGFSKEQAETLIIQSKFAHAVDKIREEELKEKVWDSVFQIVRGQSDVK